MLKLGTVGRIAYVEYANVVSTLVLLETVTTVPGTAGLLVKLPPVMVRESGVFTLTVRKPAFAQVPLPP